MYFLKMLHKLIFRARQWNQKRKNRISESRWNQKLKGQIPFNKRV